MSLFSHLKQAKGSPDGLVDALADATRRLGHWLDHRTIWILGLLTALLFALCTVAIVVLTVEPDEAWILFSTYKAFGLAVPGAQEVRFPTVTSGGLHFLIHGAIGGISRAIIVHRAVSLLSLAALCLLAFRMVRRRGAEPRDAAIAASLALLTPGLVLQASLAMGEIIVTALLLAAALYWERKGRLSLRGALASGLLLGLACATRANCLVCVPVFGAFACLESGSWKHGLGRAAALLAAAVAVYAAGVLGYAALFTIGDWNSFKYVMFEATGTSIDKPLVRQLPYILLAADFFPPFLVAALLLGLGATARQGYEPLRLPLLLVVLGLTGAAAWIAKAPIPHVRYAWPFAPLLFAAAGLLAHQNGLLAQARSRMAMQLFVIAALMQQLASSLVYVAAGDSLIAVYQANRQTALASQIGVHSDAKDQQALARYIAALPADADLSTNVGPLGFPLTYLSGRRVHNALPWDSGYKGPRYFITTPGDFAVFHPTPDVLGWVRRNCTSVFHSAAYAICAVTGSEPYPPPVAPDTDKSVEN